MLSTQSIYERYRSAIRDALARPRPRLRGPADPEFLWQAVWFWAARYVHRKDALEAASLGVADGAAAELLISRTQDRNELYRRLPERPEEELRAAVRAIPEGRLDVAALEEIPSYGPSFLALWAEAKSKRLDDAGARDAIYRWYCHVPAAWSRDASRAAQGLPAIEVSLGTKLARTVAWRQTSDGFLCWEARVDGSQWHIGLNDFPDGYLYTLWVDGRAAGEFNDWPAAWTRGEARTRKRRVAAAAAAAGSGAGAATSIAPPSTRFLERYRDGEHEAVWRDLMALGAEVRQPDYEADARAVAQETMRRAAHNIRALAERLDGLGYRFLRLGQRAARVCTPRERRTFRAWERQGLQMPLSLRAFLEQFALVNFLGYHPTLCPRDAGGRAVIPANPLVFTGAMDSAEILEGWLSAPPRHRRPIVWQVGGSAESKLAILNGERPGGILTVELPNGAADAVLAGDAQGRTFIENLRWSLRWGGFPGWAERTDRPERELALLTEGLLPL